MKFLSNILSRLGTINRMVIFLIIALAVLIPLIKTDWLNVPIKQTIYTSIVFDEISSLNENDKVLVSFAYGPSTAPEISPMAIALMKQLFAQGVKVYIISLVPESPIISKQIINEVKESNLFPNLKEYDHYVDLGYKQGGAVVIKGIKTDILSLYKQDINKKSIEDIPMMSKKFLGLNEDDKINIKAFDFVVDFSAGVPGNSEWVKYACDETGVPLTSGCTSVMVTDALAYVDKNQIRGILAGMPGAAEYEELVYEYLLNEIESKNKFINQEASVENGEIAIGDMVITKGKAGPRMNAQSLAHLCMIIFIILGNLAYFFSRRRTEQ